MDERGIPTVFEAQRHLASHCAHVVFFKSTGIPCKPKPSLLPSSVKRLVAASTFYSFAAMGLELRFSEKGNGVKGASCATAFLAFPRRLLQPRLTPLGVDGERMAEADAATNDRAGAEGSEEASITPGPSWILLIICPRCNPPHMLASTARRQAIPATGKTPVVATAVTSRLLERHCVSRSLASSYITLRRKSERVRGNSCLVRRWPMLYGEKLVKAPTITGCLSSIGCDIRMLSFLLGAAPAPSHRH